MCVSATSEILATKHLNITLFVKTEELGSEGEKIQ